MIFTTKVAYEKKTIGTMHFFRVNILKNKNYKKFIKIYKKL